MKKSKKLIYSLLGTVGAISLIVPATTSTIITTTSIITNKENAVNLSKNNEYIYVLDNKVFSSLDEVATYFINKNPSLIENKLYLGDINNAILDPSSLMLDINDLKPYNPDRLYPVYLNALNMPTYNYEEAKKTYVNKGLINYQYYDFNSNLFPSYEAAKNSIMKTKTPLGVMYYNGINVDNYQTINFNPLSKKDLLEFKKLAFQKSLSGNFLTSPFKLNIYNDDSNSDFSNDFVHNIIMDAINLYFQTKKSLFEKSLFNVSVTIDDYEYRNDHHTYVFKNFKNFNQKYKTRLTNNNDKLSFYDVSYYDLPKFNVFLNYNDLCGNNSKLMGINNYSKVTIKTRDTRHIAEEATFFDFLGTSFKIEHDGNDQGGTGWFWTIDCGLLHKGEEDGFKYPNTINFCVDVDFSSCNFKNEFFKQLEKNKLTTIGNKNDLLSNIKSAIYNMVLENLKNEDKTFDFYDQFEWDSSGDKACLTKLSDLINPLESNWFLKGNCFEKPEGNNDDDESLLNFNGADNYNNFLKKISYDKRIIEIDKFKKQLIDFIFSQDFYNFVIEYNDAPVFQFPIKLELSKEVADNKIFRYDDGWKKYYIDIKELVIKNKDKIERQYKNSEDFYNSFKNVSQIFTKNGHQIKTNLNYLNDANSYNNSFFKLNSNNELSFDYKFYQNLNKGFINEKNESIIPKLENNVDTKYYLNSLIPFYNKLLKNIKKLQPESFDKIIDDQLVSPEDIVVLYSNNTPLKFSYREFLSNGKFFLANLVNNDSIKLVSSQSDLDSLIETTQNVEPAKVVVIYDLLGNVINPGVELTKDEALLTSSDAIFDSSETIIDNILRTKLLPKDLNNIYYLDENNKYYLVKNEINQIFILNLNNKKYYFPSHQSLMNELKRYLATITTKVSYEK